MTHGHLPLDVRGARLLGRHPGELERVLLRLAVPGHRHDEGERDRVLPRVVVRGDAGRRAGTRRP